MQIIAQCPNCGNSWLLEADAADRRITCQMCRRLFKVPTLEEISKAARVIKKTNGIIYVDENGKIYG